MPTHNVRKSVTETYNPKQRIIGGIVLSLLLLLIYSILKIVLGFSSVPAGEYILSEPLIDEVPTGAVAANNATLSARPNLSRRASYRLPQKFVFLDLKGKPMEPEDLSTPQTGALSAAGIYNSEINQGKWYVQAASFRQPQRAKRLGQKIKDKKIAETVHIIETSKGWYIVRLSPQNEESVARQQKRKLRTMLRLNGIVKQIK